MTTTSSHQYEDVQSLLDLLDRQFSVSNERLLQITKGFLDEVQIGLGSYNHAMAMIPTFVTGVPDGTEKGTFLALDLGGTNLRVCEVVLNGDKTFSLTQKKFKVSEALKTGEASTLFDYLADSVDAFLTSHATTQYTAPKDEALPADEVYLGFTFSFPVQQTALDAGKILTWTKGFSARNAVGHDVVKLLQDAFDRKNMHVKCVALVNDTVGTLLTRAYITGGSFIGAIFGTGTNGAYTEELSKITKLERKNVKGEHMIINCEWGAFDNAKKHLPVTPYDNALDRISINPGYQLFEKFISGMYLGEIVRQVFLSLIDATPKGVLFNGKSTNVVNKHYGIDSSFLSAVESAWITGEQSEDAFTLPPLGSEFEESKLSPKVVSKLKEIKHVIVSTLGFEASQVTLRDAAIVQWVSHIVVRRAALLSGVAIAALLAQTGRARLLGSNGGSLKYQNETLGVGVDGSLVEHYPNFERTLRESLRHLVGEDVEKRVEIGLAKDGSGVGAALSAMQAIKQQA